MNDTELHTLIFLKLSLPGNLLSLHLASPTFEQVLPDFYKYWYIIMHMHFFFVFLVVLFFGVLGGDLYDGSNKKALEGVRRDQLHYT